MTTLTHYEMVAVYAALAARPGELTLVAAAGRRPFPPAVTYGEGLWGRAADAAETTVAQNLENLGKATDGVARRWAQIAVPLQCAGTLLGLLAVDSDQPAPFLPDDELFLENLGDLIAVRLSLAAPPTRP